MAFLRSHPSLSDELCLALQTAGIATVKDFLLQDLETLTHETQCSYRVSELLLEQCNAAAGLVNNSSSGLV